MYLRSCLIKHFMSSCVNIIDQIVNIAGNIGGRDAGCWHFTWSERAEYIAVDRNFTDQSIVKQFTDDRVGLVGWQVQEAIGYVSSDTGKCLANEYMVQWNTDTTYVWEQFWSSLNWIPTRNRFRCPISRSVGPPIIWPHCLGPSLGWTVGNLMICYRGISPASSN
jgi:hypothetical protein